MQEDFLVYLRRKLSQHFLTVQFGQVFASTLPGNYYHFLASLFPAVGGCLPDNLNITFSKKITSFIIKIKSFELSLSSYYSTLSIYFFFKPEVIQEVGDRKSGLLGMLVMFMFLFK